jgi:hypothetical protein
MRKVDDRTAANMEVALEQACAILPHGGDHKTRKRVAKKLIYSAHRGSTRLGDLLDVARTALQEVTSRKSA